MRLRISDPADRDVMETLQHGTRTYGERRADEYVTAMLDEFQWIATWPLTSREQDDVRPPVRLKPFRAHNILYDVHADEVVILRVIHHTVDWKNLL